jgi:hypothetical protein
MLKVDAERHLFTKHGLHLNKLGKQLLTIQLAQHILSLLMKEEEQNTELISLKYHEDQSQTNNNVQEKRIRKKPVTRNQDFLW